MQFHQQNLQEEFHFRYLIAMAEKNLYFNQNLHESKLLITDCDA